MHRLISYVLLVSAVTAAVGASAVETVAQQSKMPENAIKVFVPNIHCESYAKKIRSRIFTVKGVYRVVTSVKHNLAVIEPMPNATVSSKAIWETLEQGDFKVERIETPQGVITEKPKT